jgi:hypothetical protein
VDPRMVKVFNRLLYCGLGGFVQKDSLDFRPLNLA